MHLAATRILTDDVDALLAFYAGITGIGAVRRHPMFGEIRTSTGTLAIASTATIPLLGEGVAEARANRSIILDLQVEDVDAVSRALPRGTGTVGDAPRDMPWGNRSFLLRDPDGNLVNLFTPIGRAAQEGTAEGGGARPVEPGTV